MHLSAIQCEGPGVTSGGYLCLLEILALLASLEPVIHSAYQKHDMIHRGKMEREGNGASCVSEWSWNVLRQR